jgi:hypothetical protein
LILKFFETLEEVSLQNQRTQPTLVQTSKSAIWKSYTDGEHGDCKLSMDESFCFCTVTLTIAYLMGDWGVL